MIDLPFIGGDVCAKLDAAKAAYDGQIIQGLLTFAGSFLGVLGIFGAVWYERHSQEAADGLATREAIGSEIFVITRYLIGQKFEAHIQIALMHFESSSFSRDVPFVYLRAKRSMMGVYEALLPKIPNVGRSINGVMEFYSCVRAAVEISDQLADIENQVRANTRSFNRDEAVHLHEDLLDEIRNAKKIGMKLMEIWEDPKKKLPVEFFRKMRPLASQPSD